MKTAVMQPYIFPYIGYWQLIAAVDQFVILDDVSYIMKGYINRNSILLNGQAHKFTIPVKKASQNKLIKESKWNFPEEDKHKFENMIRMAYKKAPQFEQVMPLISSIIWFREEDITQYIHNSILQINKYLQIRTKIYISSSIKKDNSLKAQSRIIEICKKLNTEMYINPRGGRTLYDANQFEKEDMILRFLDTRLDKVRYKQFKNEFVSNLSVIDILMFNDIEKIKEFLEEYDLNE